jgi:hypothetical protein
VLLKVCGEFVRFGHAISNSLGDERVQLVLIERLPACQKPE